MVRSYITSAVAGAFLLGLTTAALAVTGEYGNMCTMGLASGKDIQTDCTINSWRTRQAISPRRRLTIQRSIPAKLRASIRTLRPSADSGGPLCV